MSKESSPQDATPVAPVAASGAAIPFKKLIMIGVPVFIVQFALIYFIVAKFIVSAPAAAPAKGHEASTEEAATEESSDPEDKAAEQQIFIIKDIIVNPAGTNGTRFLLTTIGIEVAKAETKAEMEKKEFQVRDALNTILTSKGLAELNSPERREMIRAEIQQKVGELIKTGKLKNVYFSKFIVQ